MKSLLITVIWTKYDDGAGATCEYGYLFTPATGFNIGLAADLWQAQVLQSLRCQQAVTFPCVYRQSVVGAPPLAATRTLTTDSSGEVVFVDADEALDRVIHRYALVECEDHLNDMPYLIVSSVPIECVITVEDDTGPLTADTDGGFLVNFIVTGDFIEITATLTAAQKALGIIPNVSAMLADRDLLLRPYTLSLVEGATKALVLFLQAAGGRYEGAIAQLASYASGRSKIVGVDIPYVYVSRRWGLT